MDKKVHFITYGCQMNVADSNNIANKFILNGFKITQEKDDADIIIINTCTVRQHAENRALSSLGRLDKWKDKNKKIIFMGCAAERLGNSVKRKFPFVDEVVGAKSLNKFDDIIKKYTHFYSIKKEKQSLKAEIKDYQIIMTGCSLKCSYCIVPKVRGPANFISSKEIISSIEEKVSIGTKEIMLLGQTVNAYKDLKTNDDFTSLLFKISKIKDLKRIRFMSPHPIFFKEDFFKLFSIEPKISRHIHLPVQSGSDIILNKMKRLYNTSTYLDIINNLRKADPNVSISTDFIVGFPGETKDDFEKTLSLARKAMFSFAYCFKYSSRTDKKEDISDVSEKEIKERLDALLKVIKQNSKKILDSKIGNIEEVLLEDSFISKTSTGFNCAIINNKGLKVGDLLKVEIVSTEKNILYGKVLK